MDLSIQVSTMIPENTHSDWRSYCSISYINYFSKASCKILALDPKNSIFKTKSSHNYPDDPFDWELIDKKLVSQFKSFVDQGFQIVAFSNDRSFSNDTKRSYEYFIKLLDIPILWIICTMDDYFALPCTGAWEYFCTNLNENIPIDLESSRLLLNHFNSSLPLNYNQSIKFSLNLGLSTISLESLIRPHSPIPQISPPSPTPSSRQVKKRGSVFQGEEAQSDIPSPSLEVIIFVGPPGSGKSTFYKTHLARYNWVNCDKYRTKSKCLEILDKSLQKKKSCVVDNLNSTRSLRSDYIQIAKKYSVTCRCFVFAIEKELALHLDRLRKINRNRKHISGFVGEVAINKFFRDFEEPGLDEGFAEIKKVQLVAGPFENSEDEKMFYSYT